MPSYVWSYVGTARCRCAAGRHSCSLRCKSSCSHGPFTTVQVPCYGTLPTCTSAGLPPALPDAAAARRTAAEAAAWGRVAPADSITSICYSTAAVQGALTKTHSCINAMWPDNVVLRCGGILIAFRAYIQGCGPHRTCTSPPASSAPAPPGWLPALPEPAPPRPPAGQ